MVTRELKMLPPAPGKCAECAVAHAPEDPHDKQSLYYQMRFRQKTGRWPTWADALAHCDDATKALWREELAHHGVKVDA